MTRCRILESLDKFLANAIIAFKSAVLNDPSESTVAKSETDGKVSIVLNRAVRIACDFPEFFFSLRTEDRGLVDTKVAKTS